MAKNPSSDFVISKTKVNKQKLAAIMVQFPEVQHAHINLFCEKQEVSVAEFARQCIAYCLSKYKNPLPMPGDAISDELKDYIKAARKAAAKRAAAKGKDVEEETEEETVEETEEEEGSEE